MKKLDVVIGSNQEFVITKAQTHSPGHGAAFQCSEPSVIPLSYPGAPYLAYVELASTAIPTVILSLSWVFPAPSLMEDKFYDSGA